MSIPGRPPTSLGQEPYIKSSKTGKIGLTTTPKTTPSELKKYAEKCGLEASKVSENLNTNNSKERKLSKTQVLKYVPEPKRKGGESAQFCIGILNCTVPLFKTTSVITGLNEKREYLQESNKVTGQTKDDFRPMQARKPKTVSILTSMFLNTISNTPKQVTATATGGIAGGIVGVFHGLYEATQGKSFMKTIISDFTKGQNMVNDGLSMGAKFMANTMPETSINVNLGSINSNVQKCVNMLPNSVVNSFKPSDLDKSIESFNKDLKSCKKSGNVENRQNVHKLKQSGKNVIAEARKKNKSDKTKKFKLAEGSDTLNKLFRNQEAIDKMQSSRNNKFDTEKNQTIKTAALTVLKAELASSNNANDLDVDATLNDLLDIKNSDEKNVLNEKKTLKENIKSEFELIKNEKQNSRIDSKETKILEKSIEKDEEVLALYSGVQLVEAGSLVLGSFLAPVGQFVAAASNASGLTSDVVAKSSTATANTLIANTTIVGGMASSQRGNKNSEVQTTLNAAAKDASNFLSKLEGEILSSMKVQGPIEKIDIKNPITKLKFETAYNKAVVNQLNGNNATLEEKAAFKAYTKIAKSIDQEANLSNFLLLSNTDMVDSRTARQYGIVSLNGSFSGKH